MQGGLVQWTFTDEILEVLERGSISRLFAGSVERLQELLHQCAALIRPTRFHCFHPGTSRLSARRSSVARRRYVCVDAAAMCPSRSLIHFSGTEARSRLTARAKRKACEPCLPFTTIPASCNRRRMTAASELVVESRPHGARTRRKT